MVRSPRAGSAGRERLAARLVDLTLAEAEAVGFENVRLHRIAEHAGVTLAEVSAIYPDLDAVANAWFARARDAMLAPPPEGFAGWPAKERLFWVMTRWLDALAPHREASVQMLRAKAVPSHPHHWVPMIFDLSRIVHWMLDAARIAGTGRMRQIEEIGMTALVLAVLAVWARDRSPGFTRTHAMLRRRLDAADRLMTRLFASHAPQLTDPEAPIAPTRR